METQLGKDIVRKEAWCKVTGAAKYTDDIIEPDALHAKLLTSTQAHARIVKIDISAASGMRGVKAVLTGDSADFLCGTIIKDRPPLAKEKVRYFGEPVAMVVADNELNAKAASAKINVQYEPLPVVNSIADSIRQGAALIHENLMNYKKLVDNVQPVANSNISNSVQIRKGSMQKGWSESEVTVEGSFKLPQSDHAAMETRTARCNILPDGRVFITTSSQAPFTVQKLISEYFNFPEGNVIVHVPFVGGGFGGKAPVQLEVLAVLASKAVGGKRVKIINTREEDMTTSPCHLGLEAQIKLGAKKDGKITAAEMTYYIDCGGYTEIAPKMTKAIAVDCTGPYKIENISCNCFTVFTNHPYTTSFRSFGHVGHAFCIERMLDKLAALLKMDPIQVRFINGVKEGDFTPTQTKITLSNTGNFAECLGRLKTLINWDEGTRIEEGNNLIRAKGVGCLCKTSDSPVGAVSGAIITFNTDGSINLSCGAVEFGPGMKTTAAQILAEKMKMSIDRIFVKMDVDSETNPKHWKTVASMTTFMMGKAIINAANDTIQQLLTLGSIILRCSPSDLEVAEEKVFVRSDPSYYVAFKDMVHGYMYPNGNSITGPIIGRGSYIMNHLTHLDRQTGKGKAGQSWTVGAQAVEIEYCTKQHSYRILKAATVIDAGKVLNPKTAKGIIMGGMCMGLGLGSSEAFLYDENAIVLDTSFRTYKMLRYGETPEYLVGFIETPQIDAPFGARGIAEHGIIGIPAALANALTRATQVEIDELPITPESIWSKKMGAKPWIHSTLNTTNPTP